MLFHIFAADNQSDALIIMKSKYQYHWIIVFCLGLGVAFSSGAVPGEPSLVHEAVTAPAMDDGVDFSFYGTSLHAAGMRHVKVASVREDDIYSAWRDYKKLDFSPVVTSLNALSDSLGLNDWFVLELVRHYADGLLPSGSPMDRVMLEYCVLSSMGYDIRLARSDRQLILLVPFDQDVYEHYFIHIDDKDYYLFYDNLDCDLTEKSVIYPCDPLKKNGSDHGRSFGLLFKDKALNVSTGDDWLCDFDDGMIHVSCMVSPCVMRMLRDYPTMDLRCYATSVVLPQFHAAIEDQLAPQLEGMSQCDAADALLHFVQNVFGYEADTLQFGREKINFVEENFYYEKNDCNDRAVLFAYLVSSLLGLDVQFVHYPGHDCTGVRFTECATRGNGYFYGDDYYLICDPTYVGAPIGHCMSEFRTVRPTVKLMVPTLASEGKTTLLEPRLDRRFIVADISVSLPEQLNVNREQ